MATARNETSARGKAALVTGAARRIGRAIALDLAAAGFDVAVHFHRSASDAAAVVDQIRAMGCDALALQADLQDEAATAGLVGLAAARLGPLSLLVNNAAVFELDRPETADRRSWDRHLDINLRAPLVLAQAFARSLSSGTRGNIVNMIDQRVLRLTPAYTSYSISKAGLLALTQHLALALAPAIRVNGIGPGLALAPASDREGRFDGMARAMPLGAASDPAEICRAIRFIVETPSMTGQMLLLDGGQHLGWLHPAQLADVRPARHSQE